MSNRIAVTPITQGLDRSVDSVAQQPGTFYELMGMFISAQGVGEQIYEGAAIDTFDTDYSPTRWIEWGDRIVVLANNPESNTYISSAGGYVTGFSGQWRAEKYKHVLPMAQPEENCRTLINSGETDVYANSSIYFSQSTYIAQINTTNDLGGSVELTFSGIQPEVPAGLNAQYVLFDRDADVDAITADIRPVTAEIYSGQTLTGLTYTGDAPPSGSVYAYVLLGTDADDMFKPDGFFVYKDRLGAWEGNNIYFSGFPGWSSPVVAPQPSNWMYWDALNRVSIDDTSRGAIVNIKEVDNALLVFQESGIVHISGYVPIDAARENQLVIRTLVNDLGIIDYDAVDVTPDGKLAYFIGDDSNFYAVAGNSLPEEIGIPVRNHERKKNLCQVTATDQFVVFGGIECDPTLVAREAYNQQSGMLQQYPTFFVLNRDGGQWSTFSRIGTNSEGDYVPKDDPSKQGGIGRIIQDGVPRLAIGSAGTIRILNDPAEILPQIEDFYLLGAATHEFDPDQATLKQMNHVTAQVEGPYSYQLSATAPISRKNNDSPVVRTTPFAVNGATTNYSVWFYSPPVDNYVSAGIGLCSEYLVGGVNQFPATINSGSSAILQFEPYDFGGYVARIDMYMSSVPTDLELRIYAHDEGTGYGAIDDPPVFTTEVTQPASGLVTDTTPYWHSFDIRQEFDDSTWWIGIFGSAAQVYYYPTASNIHQAIDPLQFPVTAAGSSFMLRIVRELGEPFVCRKFKGMQIEYQNVGNTSY